MSKSKIVHSGWVLDDKFICRPWEIEKVGKEHYVLRIGGEFYSSADNRHALLDEITTRHGKVDNMPNSKMVF